ncbi:MAG: YjfB family protein [Lachnospiraceae bacterium]|nr:YjfB family protein [Lachnospiraceae bacterium]
MADPTGTIQSVASSLSAAKTNNAVGTAMLSKALDNQDAVGAAMIKMMEHSVNPEIGGNIDISG